MIEEQKPHFVSWFSFTTGVQCYKLITPLLAIVQHHLPYKLVL